MQLEYEITLEQILKARDDRAEKQKILINKYHMPLISFTVNMPGIRKKTPLSGKLFWEGFQVFDKKLADDGIPLVCQETYDLLTGYEAYIVADISALALKELTIQVENQHPLGRLWDFDVIERDGRLLSRETLGYPKRKCLLCNEDANACARSRLHSQEDLINRMQVMSDVYFYSTQGR